MDNKRIIITNTISKNVLMCLLHMILLLIVILFFSLFMFSSSKIDKMILLEYKRPAYWEALGNTYTKYETSYYDNCLHQYRLSVINKDGLGIVTPEDLLFFIKMVLCQYPEAEWTILLFEDGTGIEIDDEVKFEASYGLVLDTGRINNQKRIDLNQSLIQQIDGITTIQYKYDKKGNPIHEKHIDAYNNLVANKDGIAEYHRAYDDDNHLLWEKKIGVDGIPCLNEDGYAEIALEYDDDDNIIKESYYDGYGRPVTLVKGGYSSVTMEYDINHRVISECFFDRDGNPTISYAGYSIRKKEYDGNKLKKEEFYNIDGAPMIVDLGYSAIGYEYHDYGRVASEKYYGVDGNVINCINGYAQIDYDYDINGNEISKKFFDKNGLLVLTAEGYAEIKKIYDDDKRIIMESFYGVDGNTVVQAGGYTSYRQIWGGENKDVLILREYLDNGFPVVRSDGYSIVDWKQENGTWNVSFKDENEKNIELEGLNLIRDVRVGKDGWSEWMTPKKNISNSNITIGSVNLGKKTTNDMYTCQIEIEFKNVSGTSGEQFSFWTQGAQDGKWLMGNIWNDNLVFLSDAPEDGVYKYTFTTPILEGMDKVSNFDIGFRCDYWSSGCFRVKNIKIEKGSNASKWSPGI